MFARIGTAYSVIFHCIVCVLIHLAEYFQLLVVKLRNPFSPFRPCYASRKNVWKRDLVIAIEIPLEKFFTNRF